MSLPLINSCQNFPGTCTSTSQVIFCQALLLNNHPTCVHKSCQLTTMISVQETLLAITNTYLDTFSTNLHILTHLVILGQTPRYIPIQISNLTD